MNLQARIKQRCMSNLNLGWIAVGGCYNMFGDDNSCPVKYKMVMILFKYFKILPVY